MLACVIYSQLKKIKAVNKLPNVLKLSQYRSNCLHTALLRNAHKLSICTNVLNSRAFIKKPRQYYACSFWRSHCRLNIHLATDAATREWVCGISGNHGPRMRQCLRSCHRSVNARIAPEPHLHAVEAGRLHSNQKCLHKGRALSAADSTFPARCGV